ncbi:19343_t:CDS:2 [Entrophospora sp. SA101]|nr:19343_t:CDS:2 [Entrophospora sp. SA101]
MARDTIALVKHLGIKQFNLLGWSMGGIIALCVALNIPSDLKLEKLIICSSFARPIANQIFEDFYNLPELDPPKSVQEQKDMITATFSDYLLEHPDKLDKLAKLNIHRPFEIYTQTLLVHGEADDIVPIRESELLEREIPGAQFYRIPKVRHA